MSISGWFREAAAERRAEALVQARANREPLDADRLGELSPALFVALGRLAGEADAKRARAAVEVLALTRAPEAVAPLVDALHQAEVWARLAIARALQQLQAPASALMPLATHPSAHVRAAALPALAELPDGPRLVTMALRDSASEVRAAALLLVQGDDLAALTPLLDDADAQVRARACDALARTAARRPVALDAPSLAAAVALLSEPPPVREAAARLLAQTSEPAAREALHEAATRGNLEAIRALGAIGGPRAREVLVRALGRPGCVGVAAEALAALGDASVVPDLELALVRIPNEEDPSDTPSDRSATEKAIASLRRVGRI